MSGCHVYSFTLRKVHLEEIAVLFYSHTKLSLFTYGYLQIDFSQPVLGVVVNGLMNANKGVFIEDTFILRQILYVVVPYFLP